MVSGRATVIGFTVNHHQWLPGFEPPYVIANVALAEDPAVRLTTNIVGCEPDEVRVGQEVMVRFEQYDDVWLPLFEPTGQTTRSTWFPNHSARRHERPSTPTASSTGPSCPGSDARRWGGG